MKPQKLDFKQKMGLKAVSMLIDMIGPDEIKKTIVDGYDGLIRKLEQSTREEMGDLQGEYQPGIAIVFENNAEGKRTAKAVLLAIDSERRPVKALREIDVVEVLLKQDFESLLDINKIEEKMRKAAEQEAEAVENEEPQEPSEAKPEPLAGLPPFPTIPLLSASDQLNEQETTQIYEPMDDKTINRPPNEPK